MHIFVDDARHTLQDLWDKLYFSGEDIMEFSPAHSEVYTDALLSAHEMEIKRLQVMLGERAPILSLINKHHELMDDKEQLAISSNDASRLMARGTKGERDPTRLLREEKMRKRVAKELPRVEVELKKALEQWEEDYGEPLLVKGENYLDTILQHSPIVPPARTKTPGPGGLPRGRSNTTSSLSSHSSQSAQRAKSRPNIKENVQMKPPPRSKTPTARPKTPGATTQSYVYSGASTVGRSGGRSLVSVIDRGTTGTTVTPSLGITPSLGPRLRAANSNTSPTRGSRAPLQTFHTSTQPIKQPEPQAPSTIGRNSSIKRKFGPSAANVFGTVPKMLALQQLNEMQQKTLTPYMRHQLELEQHEREDDTRLSQGGASIRSVSPYGSDAPSYRSYNGHDDSNSPTSDTRATPRAKSYRPNMKNFMEYESSVRGSQTSVDSRQFSSSTMSTISSASTPEGGGSENWEVYGEDSDGEQQPAAYYRPKNRGAYGSNGSSSSVGLVRQGAREEGWLSESGGVGGGGNAY